MFVISIKRIRKYNGEKLNDKDQYWEYGMYDRYAGSFSTGYPCFGNLSNSEKFKTVEEARKWWNSCKKNLRYDAKDYDRSTLGIRECIFKTVEKLS